MSTLDEQTYQKYRETGGLVDLSFQDGQVIAQLQGQVAQHPIARCAVSKLGLVFKERAAYASSVRLDDGLPPLLRRISQGVSQEESNMQQCFRLAELLTGIPCRECCHWTCIGGCWDRKH